MPISNGKEPPEATAPRVRQSGHSAKVGAGLVQLRALTPGRLPVDEQLVGLGVPASAAQAVARAVRTVINDATRRPTARVERAAERLFEAHGISKAPVDVHRLATLTGITVAFDDLGSNDVSGTLYRRSTASVMVINMHHSPHRQRFTIAHELGHAELHDSDTYLDGLATLRFRDGKSATGSDAEEREANRYAAALLMPAAWAGQIPALGHRTPPHRRGQSNHPPRHRIRRQPTSYALPPVSLNLINPA